MRKIVIDARELRTSTGRYIERLLFYLQKIDDQHDYVVLLKPEDVAGWQPTNPHFSVVACPYKEFGIGEQFGFIRQLYSLHPDLVHFGMTQQPIFYRGKVVTTIHDLTILRFRNPAKNWLVFSFKQWVYRLVLHHAAHKSVRVLNPSEFVKKDVLKTTKAKNGKFVVTNEAADKITDVAEAVSSLAGKKFLLYVGRPQPHKNLDRLVEAFALLRQKQPDLVLVLAGKKDELYERLQNRIDKLGIENVVLLGYVREGQLRWLYEHTAAYVFPSLSEGFGLPGLEAMQHGAPVVSSDATCLPEIYKDAAIYFDPLSIQDMAEKIGMVLEHPTLANELKAKGSELVKQYSWRRMADQTLEVYNEVLGEN